MFSSPENLRAGTCRGGTCRLSCSEHMPARLASPATHTQDPLRDQRPPAAAVSHAAHSPAHAAVRREAGRPWTLHVGRAGPRADSEGQPRPPRLKRALARASQPETGAAPSSLTRGGACQRCLGPASLRHGSASRAAPRCTKHLSARIPRAWRGRLARGGLLCGGVGEGGCYFVGLKRRKLKSSMPSLPSLISCRLPRTAPHRTAPHRTAQPRHTSSLRQPPPLPRPPDRLRARRSPPHGVILAAAGQHVEAAGQLWRRPPRRRAQQARSSAGRRHATHTPCRRPSARRVQ